jgi:hypothetical protein
MKLYYDGIGYPCKFKSQMKGKNTWYSMEPISIKPTFPKYIYDRILLDIKLDSENDIFIFKLLLQKGDLSRKEDNSQVVQNELWEIKTYLERCVITSKFRNGDVTVKFSLSIFEEEELDKSDIREVILMDLFKSEKQE